MKTLMIILSLFLSITINAQTINDFPIDSIKVEYLQLIVRGKFLSNEVAIIIDYGQLLSTPDQIILKDENNKPIPNGMINTLNFFAKYGWEYCDTYVVTLNGNSALYSYIMRNNKI